MSSVWGTGPLCTRRLGSAEADAVLQLDFPAEQLDRFLGPLTDIVHATRRGLAHHLFGIGEAGRLIGFFAVHPDRRDASRWWLGWFGIDRAHQGGGRGRRVLADIVARLHRIPGCREVVLLVAPENGPARRLYERAGFTLLGVARATGELLLRCVLPAVRPSGGVPARFWANAILLAVIDARSCRMGLPMAAKLHGEVAFPP